MLMTFILIFGSRAHHSKNFRRSYKVGPIYNVVFYLIKKLMFFSVKEILSLTEPCESMIKCILSNKPSLHKKVYKFFIAKNIAISER